jgi:site-specific DNA recombinase
MGADLVNLMSTTTLTRLAPIRVALYGRYSSDQQNPKSVDAQFMVCREYAARHPDWQIVEEYRDDGVSGASLVQRPGMRKLLDAATQGKFDVVLAEAMDRLSRDDVDMPYINKKLNFAGVTIFTLAEGEITKLHVGMKGTMNSVFLDDLKAKTHRGLEWAVSVEGKVIGRSYGYETVREFDARGEPIRGVRKINPKETEIVTRILTEYANGGSPDAIAGRLRDEGVLGPSGKPWTSSTIRGDARRGTGIINNELYIGKIVWNRTNHPKHPDTGKPVNRVNPREKWITADAPELGFVSPELWERVKIRQREIAEKYLSVINGTRAYYESRAQALNSTHRPSSFLSGLMVCGVCEGPYTARGNHRFSCSNHRHRSYPNQRTITREEIEERVLAGLRGPFLDGANIEKVVRELVDETERLNHERMGSHHSARKSLAEIQDKIDHIMAAIERGAFSDTVNQRLCELEAAKKEAEKRLASEKPAKVCIPGKFEEMLRRKIDNLPATLRSLEEADEAMSLVRELVSRVVITPHPDKGRGAVALTLHGCLGTLLNRVTGRSGDVLPSVESGAGIHREQHSLVVAI